MIKKTITKKYFEFTQHSCFQSTKNTSYMENLQKQLSEYEDKIKQMEQLMDTVSIGPIKEK